MIYYFYATTRVEREEVLLPILLGERCRDYRATVPRFRLRLSGLRRAPLWHWDAYAFSKNHGVTDLLMVFLAPGLLYL